MWHPPPARRAVFSEKVDETTERFEVKTFPPPPSRIARLLEIVESKRIIAPLKEINPPPSCVAVLEDREELEMETLLSVKYKN